MTIDLFPTIAKLISAPLIDNQINGRKIDGLDIWPLLASQPGAKSPHEVLYFYWLNRLDAVRSGRWKLHLPHDYPHPEQLGGDAENPAQITPHKIELSLLDLETDVGETTNVAAEHSDVVARLQTYVEARVSTWATRRQDAREPASARRANCPIEPSP